LKWCGLDFRVEGLGGSISYFGRICGSLICCGAGDDMGWLRLVGSLKSQVSFAKEPYKRDHILQKRPIILSLLIVATPYL